MGAIFSTAKKSVSSLEGSTTIEKDYPLASSGNNVLVITYSMTLIYFIMTILIIMGCIQLELSPQAICFLSISLIYSSITVSVSSISSLFTLLEIITWTTMIEIFEQLEFDSISWLLVFIVPVLCLVNSLYYLLFYLI